MSELTYDELLDLGQLVWCPEEIIRRKEPTMPGFRQVRDGLYPIGSRVRMGSSVGVITAVNVNDPSFPYVVKFDDRDYEVCPLWNQLQLEGADDAK